MCFAGNFIRGVAAVVLLMFVDVFADASAAVASHGQPPATSVAGSRGQAAVSGTRIGDSGSVLILTIGHAGVNPAPPPEQFSVLICPPSRRGNHRSAEACSALESVNGDFGSLSWNLSKICTKEYNPVVVTALGKWNDEPVAWKHVYGNPCELRAHTGPVFDF
ncbi:SSI family serine proteinase inhibitor [Streptomyces klenkii]|uniref:SSI family serine proteinase inhibitor n=1 Tax=Streptomyces klenkii TaxID=1420899 RepID=UPI0033A0DC03